MSEHMNDARPWDGGRILLCVTRDLSVLDGGGVARSRAVFGALRQLGDADAVVCPVAEFGGDRTKSGRTRTMLQRCLTFLQLVLLLRWDSIDRLLMRFETSFDSRLLEDHVGTADAVWFVKLNVFARYSHVVRRSGTAACVLDLDDLDDIKTALSAAQSTGGHRRALMIKADLQRRLRLRAMERAAVVVACSSEDAARVLKDCQGTPVRVVPNGVPRRRYLGPGGSDIAMLANWRHGANVDGLRWFIYDVLPTLRAAGWRGNLQLVGAGNECIPDFVRSMDSVEVRGFVAELENAFAGVGVSVCPLRYGSGSRIKILDSFSLGLPVVSTTVGAEGLNCIDGVHIVIRDDGPAFAHAVWDLIQNEDSACEITARALTFVREKFGDQALTGAIAYCLSAFPNRNFRPKGAEQVSGLREFDTSVLSDGNMGNLGRS